jgi:hypothetical protein
MISVFNVTHSTTRQQLTICPAAQHDSNFQHVQQQNMKAVRNMPAAQHDSSLQYDQQHKMTAVYNMTSRTE